MESARMVNIGCGLTCHPDWINLDVVPLAPSVLAINIYNGLPFSSDSVDVCYSSHVLEHLNKRGTRKLLDECMRVLRPRGVLRLVVPDLEVIARNYLNALEVVAGGDNKDSFKYDWALLEMYDQIVRNTHGGEMAEFLSNLSPEARVYVRSRIGDEAVGFWSASRCMRKRSFWDYFSANTFPKYLRMARLRLAGVFVLLLAGKDALKGFEMGMFRNNGEVHQWMYDRYSLSRLLQSAGFVDIKVCSSTESRIHGYSRYELDNANGTVRKPDSIFIEALKP